VKTGRIVLTVVGTVLALVGVAIMLAGAGLMFLHTQRDAEGYLTSPAFTLETDGYALATDEALLLEADPGTDRVPFLDRLDLRIEVERGDGEVFVGIAPEGEVAAYLEGVTHSEVERLAPGAGSRLAPVEGGRTPQPPTEVGLWTASAAGSAPLTLDGEAEAGRWAGVIMNADGSPGIDVTVSGAVRTGSRLPAGIAVTVIGLVLLLAGVAMVVAGLAVSQPPARAVPPTVPAGEGSVPPGANPWGGVPDRPFPLRLEATLDPGLTRWQ
jgi:uncharacterized membrane protein